MAVGSSARKVRTAHGALHGAHRHDHDHEHHHHLDHDHGHHHHHSSTAFHSHGVEIELDFSIMLGISLLCGTFLLFGHIAAWRGDDPTMSAICFGLAIIVGGAIPLLEALPGLLRMRPDVESLMVFAALGAWALGHPSEGAVLMLLFSLARALEGFAVGRTRQQLNTLKEHWNESATLLTDDGEQEVPFGDLVPGDRILVRPGGRIASDGVVVLGSSSVNEAALTGEPLPVDKAVGDNVYGGSLNLQGVLTIEVTAGAGESTLSRMVRMIEEAQEQEALTQRVVEWTTERYSTLVLLAAIVILTVPHIYFRQPLDICLYRAFALLVVASPCALVISTPASILMAITAATRRGILLKGGVHLEAAAAVRVVALDKTGTLTRGEPHVTTIFAADGQADSLLALAAGVERLSEHPLAKPVVDAARDRKLDMPEATDFLAVTGRGVQAHAQGKLVRIGSPRFMDEQGIAVPDALRAAAEPLEERGERTLYVAADDRAVGFIALADTIRPEAPALVRDLKRAGIRRVVMLTGDTAAAAQAIGAACGVDEVRADLLPGDKLTALEELRAEHGRVIMVGDGINDAPALAASDVGVAMGGIGSDLALESADVILIKDDLWRLPAFIDLARKATRMILFNLAFAMGVIGVMTFLVFRSAASTGSVSLVASVWAHEGSTLFVLLNASRLLRWRSRYDERN